MQRDTDERRLLHALSLSVLASDETGVVAFANDAATELFRTSADELVGRRVGELVELDAGDRAGAARRARRRPLAGRPDHPARRRRDAWSPRSRSRRSATPPAPSSAPIIALEDMTEIRRAEAEAAESELRLRLAHAAAELGTWHWNAVDGTNVWDDADAPHLRARAGRLRRHLGRLGRQHPPRRPGRGDRRRRSGRWRSAATYVLRHRIVRPGRQAALDRGARQGARRSRRRARPAPSAASRTSPRGSRWSSGRRTPRPAPCCSRRSRRSSPGR